MAPKVRPPWIEYLLYDIKMDADPAINKYLHLFEKVFEKRKLNLLTEEQIRGILTPIRDFIVEDARAKNHAFKLIDATIEFIVDPTKQI